MKKIVFLSDAHLDGRDDKTLPGLVAFLKSLKGDTSALYIGGDFFDFWMDDNPLCILEYRPVLEALRELKDRGTEITYIEGNHDFYLGKSFTEVIGARVLPGACIEHIDGKKIYFAHGDLVDKRDYAYRLFRVLMHNKGVLYLSKVIPPSWVWRVARLFSKKSRNNRHLDNPRLAAAYRRFAERKFEEGYDVVILAHLHTPGFTWYTHEGTPRLFVTLGGWLAGHSYVEYRRGKFIQRQWKTKKFRSRRTTSS